MIKKFLTVFFGVAICCIGFFSCKKVRNSTTDPTLNYFPLVYGKSVTYAVDSIYYYPIGNYGYNSERHFNFYYTIKNTFPDQKNRLSYILDVYSQPYDGSGWTPSRVIYVTPTANSLLYTQDGTE